MTVDTDNDERIFAHLLEAITRFSLADWTDDSLPQVMCQSTDPELSSESSVTLSSLFSSHASTPFTPATSPAQVPNLDALHSALASIAPTPLPNLDEPMADANPKLFKGDGVGENATDFLNSMRRRNLLSPSWKDDEKLARDGRAAVGRGTGTDETGTRWRKAKKGCFLTDNRAVDEMPRNDALLTGSTFMGVSGSGVSLVSPSSNSSVNPGLLRSRQLICAALQALALLRERVQRDLDHPPSLLLLLRLLNDPLQPPLHVGLRLDILEAAVVE
ncbi:hypothetical protein B0H10DRAFT_1955626 [Mycena sp. CBHHK59/15]|nr:hypothetical protein B0H10DRAFT_1955626 [Mycena sp. CBHHK59/15]